MIYEYQCIDCRKELIQDYRKWSADNENKTLTDAELSDTNFTMQELYESGASDLKFEEWTTVAKAAENPHPTCPECGGNNTQRILSTFAIHEGLTRAEKNAGTTRKRVEFAKHCKDVRDKRKKESEPGTRAHDSNEYWVGGENLKGVINPKSYIKTKHTYEAPKEALEPRPAMKPEIVQI